MSGKIAVSVRPSSVRIMCAAIVCDAFLRSINRGAGEIGFRSGTGGHRTHVQLDCVLITAGCVFIEHGHGQSLDAALIFIAHNVCCQ